MRRMYSKEQLIKLIKENSTSGEVLTPVVTTNFDSIAGSVTISKNYLIISIVADVAASTAYQNQWMKKLVCTVDIPEQYRSILENSIVHASNEFKVPAYIVFDTKDAVGVNVFEYYADVHKLKIYNFNQNEALTGTHSVKVFIQASISLGGE